jgi:1L-myo-inositol 1-phosphate cytidylyltransferase / CDP-L-myo-inositol myo-inositolphosphotransferase
MCNIQGTVVPSLAVVVFANPAAASRNIAGLPAAARAVREAALAGIGECWLTAGPEWHPDEPIRAEVDRLAQAMPVQFLADWTNPADFAAMPVIWLSGERLVADSSLEDRPGDNDLGNILPDSGLSCAEVGEAAGQARLGQATSAALLAAATRRIVAATGKPGDGIVSRLINRPISQAISKQLLRFPQIRPVHATWITALLALAMAIALLTGGHSGLIAGTLLFQAASIFDGVDGEIARATFRSSRRGAMLDSLVDAAANVGFIGGVVINLWIAGSREVALAGAGGLAMMALGLFVIGRRAAKGPGPFTFNGVKDRVCAGGSRLGQWLTWLTMRDFYAFAAVVFVVSGFTEAGLLAFAAAAACWLAVVLFVMGVPSRQTA